MTTSRKTQSALRAALKNEDASLAQRLPDTGKATKPAPANPALAKPVATKPPAAKPVRASASAPEVKAASGKAVSARKSTRPKPVAQRAPAKAQAKAIMPVPATADAALSSMAASVDAASVPIRPMALVKPEKRVRETFSLVRSDIDRLAALKARAEKRGSKVGRSEMVRAGLLLLETQDVAKVTALIEQLPAFKKDKRKKK